MSAAHILQSERSNSTQIFCKHIHDDFENVKIWCFRGKGTATVDTRVVSGMTGVISSEDRTNDFVVVDGRFLN